MIGNNELLFNQATMQEIVAHYLNTVLFRATEVRVSEVVQLLDGYEKNFKVVFIPNKPEDKPA